jgi:hypothetical protein
MCDLSSYGRTSTMQIDPVTHQQVLHSDQCEQGHAHKNLAAPTVSWDLLLDSNSLDRNQRGKHYDVSRLLIFYQVPNCMQ